VRVGRVWIRFSAVLRHENVKYPPNRLRFLRFHKMPLHSAAAFLTQTRESEDAGRITILQNAAFVRHTAANIETKQARSMLGELFAKNGKESA
jgi:hypothetical protein